MNASELREMSDEQLELTLKETCENLFRLRLQAQTERLDAPSELKKHRRMIARIKTIQRQRQGDAEQGAAEKPADSSAPAASSAAEPAVAGAES